MNTKLIMIPTYNESENIRVLYRQIADLKLKDTDLLFVDDNSPDGTGSILEGLKKKDSKLFVLHRKRKLGIGSAHLSGIDYAYKHRYQKLITMDADFSHSPKYIINFLKAADRADVIVASRYLKKNSLPDWNIIRKFLTFTGHILTTRLLKMEYDATGAFRLYNLENLPKAVFNLISSRGYSFFFESLYIINFNKYSIAEIPIKLPARSAGHSKMKITDIWQSIRYLWIVFRTTKKNPKRYLLRLGSRADSKRVKR